ncbi:MAG: hypothetical protein HY711_05950, partial [Candidatus Melainabacteria bacterium]|nr:hypothetical protein [Candidatus Melainabacteria bacterium]
MSTPKPPRGERQFEFPAIKIKQEDIDAALLASNIWCELAKAHREKLAFKTTKTTGKDLAVVSNLDRLCNKSYLAQNLTRPAKVSEQLSEAEYAKLKTLGKTKRELEQVRSEVNRFGVNPISVLEKGMRDNRILGIGETHQWGVGVRALGPAVIGKLKAAGATHLAIEA